MTESRVTGNTEREDRLGLTLTAGFGTVAAMWATGYVGRLPGVQAPPRLLGLLFLGITVAGGAVAGRWSTRSLAAGARTGLTAWLVNLLILGSLLAGGRSGAIHPSAPVFLAGALLAGMLLGGLGGWLGGRRQTAPPPTGWTHRLVLVACAATFFLLIAGGVVTSERAGLAVVDWPNSFGYNMFLYPLSRMTGGIYYEHAHRLLGSLVGLTTLVLAIYITLREPRRWVRRMAWGALLLVMLQGLLGGLRVTGHLTLATDPALTHPSLVLAAVHGVTGQLFFALLVALAVVTAPSYQNAAHEAGIAPSRGLETALLAVLLLQLTLGAIQRHFAHGLVVHITVAAAVTGLAAAAALRSMLRGEIPEAVRPAKALLALVGLQLSLGVGALVASMTRPPAGAPRPWQALALTAHQANGALVLAAAVTLLVWRTRRSDTAHSG